ncbi:hypothetical protein J6590_047567 [Homalodisca vitripennis]|nr:hypothetical protein J6590_047567 [Homalodisca vitripennis]
MAIELENQTNKQHQTKSAVHLPLSAASETDSDIDNSRRVTKRDTSLFTNRSSLNTHIKS